MKHLKRTALAAMATTLFALLAAGTASATTLEVGGAKKTETVPLTLTAKAGTSMPIGDTFGFSGNTCTVSEIKGTTSSPYTGATVTATISTLSFASCYSPVTVHKGGTLHFSHIAGTTNATVESSGADYTTSSPFGTLTCTTGTGTHLGTLTGVASGHATLSINPVLGCSGVSMRWQATYTVTSPTGLGVSA